MNTKSVILSMRYFMQNKFENQENYNCRITTDTGEEYLVYANWLHNERLDNWQGWHGAGIFIMWSSKGNRICRVGDYFKYILPTRNENALC